MHLPILFTKHSLKRSQWFPNNPCVAIHKKISLWHIFLKDFNSQVYKKWWENVLQLKSTTSNVGYIHVIIQGVSFVGHQRSQNKIQEPIKEFAKGKSIGPSSQTTGNSVVKYTETAYDIKSWLSPLRCCSENFVDNINLYTGK